MQATLEWRRRVREKSGFPGGGTAGFLGNPEGSGRPRGTSGAEGCVPRIAALVLTKAPPGEEREGEEMQSMGVRGWLLQEAGAKARLDVEGFLRGNGCGPRAGGGGRGEGRARLSAHLPPVKQRGSQPAQPPRGRRKNTCEPQAQSSQGPQFLLGTRLPWHLWEQPGGTCDRPSAQTQR